MTAGRYAGIFLLISALMLWPARAQALCTGLSISNISTTETFAGGSGEYNSFDTATYTQTVSFDVNGGAVSVLCSYFVDLSAGTSGNSSARTLTLGGQSLNYTVYTSAAQTALFKDAATATVSQVISGSFPIGSSGAVNHYSFTWTITPQQIRLATQTRYSDTLTLTLYSGIIGVIGATPVSPAKTLIFQTKVDSSVDVSLVDSTLPFDINDRAQTVDFGNMTSGAAQGFDLIIRSNDGYKLTLQSANKQTLAYQGTATDKVGYGLKINGTAVDLSAGTAVSPLAVSGVKTTASGVVLPVVVTLGTLTGHETSGTYKDVVTVSVVAN